MNELISGKEAWIAIYEGDQVEFLEGDNWDSLNKYFCDFDMDDFKSEKYNFRLKPKTITINGVEVDKPKLISSADCESLSIHFSNQEERNRFLNALHNRAF